MNIALCLLITVCWVLDHSLRYKEFAGLIWT